MNGKNVTPGIVGGEPPRGFHLDVRTRGFVATAGPVGLKSTCLVAGVANQF